MNKNTIRKFIFTIFVLVLFFIIFIAVVIFSTTAFALIDNPKLPTDIDLDYISGGEALYYNKFSSF